MINPLNWIGCRTPLAAFLTLLSGCCVPFPSRTPVAPTVYGLVKDAKSGGRIPGAKLHASRGRFESHTQSTSSGRYCVPALHQQHYFLFLPYPFPFPVRWSDVPLHAKSPPLEIQITSPGYENAKLVFHSPFDVSRRQSLDHRIRQNGRGAHCFYYDISLIPLRSSPIAQLPNPSVKSSNSSAKVLP